MAPLTRILLISVLVSVLAIMGSDAEEEGCKALCASKAEPGICRGAKERWAYDSAKKTCTKFIYGGCGGNDNNFEEDKACLDACKACK